MARLRISPRTPKDYKNSSKQFSLPVQWSKKRSRENTYGFPLSEDRMQPTEARSDDENTIEASVTIRRPVEDVFAFYRDFTNLPQLPG